MAWGVSGGRDTFVSSVVLQIKLYRLAELESHGAETASTHGPPTPNNNGSSQPARPNTRSAYIIFASPRNQNLPLCGVCLCPTTRQRFNCPLQHSSLPSHSPIPRHVHPPCRYVAPALGLQSSHYNSSRAQGKGRPQGCSPRLKAQRQRPLNHLPSQSLCLRSPSYQIRASYRWPVFRLWTHRHRLRFYRFPRQVSHSKTCQAGNSGHCALP